MSLPLHPEPEQLELAVVLDALSDPLRLEILVRLADQGELTCGKFGDRAPKTNLTYHFHRLIAAGLVSVRAKGTQRILSLRRDAVDARFPGVLTAVIGAARAA